MLNRNLFLKLNNIELITVAELRQDKNRRILHINLSNWNSWLLVVVDMDICGGVSCRSQKDYHAYISSTQRAATRGRLIPTRGISQLIIEGLFVPVQPASLFRALLA